MGATVKDDLWNNRTSIALRTTHQVLVNVLVYTTRGIFEIKFRVKVGNDSCIYSVFVNVIFVLKEF